jgi:hypothetical protein
MPGSSAPQACLLRRPRPGRTCLRLRSWESALRSSMQRVYRLAPSS